MHKETHRDLSENQPVILEAFKKNVISDDDIKKLANPECATCKGTGIEPNDLVNVDGNDITVVCPCVKANRAHAGMIKRFEKDLAAFRKK